MTVHRFWWGEAPLPHPIIDRYVSSLFQTLDWSFDNLPYDVQELAGTTGEHVDPSDLPRHYANVARIFILLEHGGVYLDHDIIPLTNFDHLPLPFIGSYGGVHRAVWPGVMGFPAHHPMLVAARDSLRDVGARRGLLDVSGSNLLADLLTDDVTLRPLACDATGQPLVGEPFAFHVGNTR